MHEKSGSIENHLYLQIKAASSTLIKDPVWRAAVITGGNISWKPRLR
jgi:hypothetical protein